MDKIQMEEQINMTLKEKLGEIEEEIKFVCDCCEMWKKWSDEASVKRYKSYYDKYLYLLNEKHKNIKEQNRIREIIFKD